MRGGPDARNALILTVVAVLVRFPTLDVQSFDRDEAVTVDRVLQPTLWGTLEAVPGETSPPLYYALAWMWSQVFGLGETGIRSLSALAAAATVPVVYEIGRTLVSRRVGGIAGALIAVNPLLFWFSHEARPYALLVFLCALSLLCLVKELQQPSRTWLAGWVVASVLAFATHWFAAFLILPEALWLLHRSPDRRRALLALCAAAGAAAPLLPLLIHQAAHGGGDWIGTVALRDRLRGTGEQFVTGATGAYIDLPAAAAVAALVCLALGLLAFLADERERRGGLLALGAGGAVVLVPLMIALLGPDYLVDKNLLPALVPLAIAVAAGMGARRAGRAGTATAVALCGLWLAVIVAVVADPALQRADWRGAVRAMGEPPPGARVIVAPFNHDASLEIYTAGSRTLKESSARVSEVVVFSRVEPTVVRLPPGFRQVERRDLQSFRMTRFRADRPIRVQHRALATTDFGGACNPSPGATGCEGGVVVLQRAVHD